MRQLKKIERNAICYSGLFILIIGLTFFCGKYIIALPTTISSIIKFKLNNFKPKNIIDTSIHGDVRVEILDNKNICVIGTYASFLQSRFEVECSDFLKGIDSPVANLKEWSRNVFYNVMGAEIILKYRPQISKAYQSYDSFEIDNSIKILIKNEL